MAKFMAKPTAIPVIIVLPFAVFMLHLLAPDINYATL